MPRRSAASLSTLTADPTPRRVPPPDNLTTDQAARWLVITATKPVDWLTADSIGLLTELVRAECESARIADALMLITSADMASSAGMARYTALAKSADLWSKAQVNLCRALRLTPHSRIAPKVAGHAALRGGPKPWEFTGYEADGTNKFDQF